MGINGSLWWLTLLGILFQVPRELSSGCHALGTTLLGSDFPSRRCVSQTLNKLCPVKGSTCDLVMDQLDLIGRFGGSRLPRPVRAWSLACWVWTVRARPPPLKWCRASWHPRRERCASLEAWLRLFYGVSWCFMLVSRVFQPTAAMVQRF